jgi:hypothetical protein
MRVRARGSAHAVSIKCTFACRAGHDESEVAAR